MREYIEFLEKKLNHPNLKITLQILECLDYIENNIDHIEKEVDEKNFFYHPDNKLAVNLAEFNTKTELLQFIREVRNCFSEILAIEDPIILDTTLSNVLNNIKDSEKGSLRARLQPALNAYQSTQKNKMFLSEDELWNLLCYASKYKAEHILKTITALIKTEHPQILRAKVTQFRDTATDTPYRFRLSVDQWETLRKKIRNKEKKIKPETDFIIKSLRVDENYFYPRFLETVFPPYKRHPLRPRRKEFFVVTGEGIFQREKDKGTSPYKIKEPKYKPEEKKGFSQPQSATLGLTDFDPKVFGHSKARNNKLVGILFPKKDVLDTDRNYIYDNGTRDRPNEFYSTRRAQKYFNEKVGKVLFSSANLDAFKKAIKEDANKNYNEILARLRFSEDGNFIVASDTLEARLWVQEFVRILKSFLTENELDPLDDVPICFYLPDNPDLHFKTYGRFEQEMDKLEAYSIYSNEALRQKKYEEKNYEILLALPAEQIENVFKENFQNKNLILTMLSNGYVHVFQSLLQKVDAETQKKLNQMLSVELLKEENRSLLSDILFYSLHSEEKALADFIFKSSQFENQSLTINPDKNPLIKAGEKGYVEWISKILLNKGFNVNNQNNQQKTFLKIAAEKDKFHIVQEALKYPDIDVNLADNNGYTPLMSAAAFGHDDIVAALLRHKNIDVNRQDRDRGLTALMWALRSGPHVALELLKHPNINILLNDYDGNTALNHAAIEGHVEVVKELLKRENMNINVINNLGSTPLMSAASYGHTDTVVELLQQKNIDVNRQDNKGKTALMWALKEDLPNTPLELLERQNAALELLKHQKINIHLKDTNGNTALRMAMVLGHDKVVTELLKREDIDVNVVNNLGFTPLMSAAAYGHTNIVIDCFSKKTLMLIAKITRARLH